jgi:hypothetical protein
MAVVGTDWITLLGTLVGTLVDSMITADGDDPIVMYNVLGSLETYVNGTTTGELKLDGTSTDDGMKTNELAGIDVTTDLGRLKTALDGTEVGTFVLSTTANPAVDKMITWVDGNEVTTEVATKTGDDQTDGIVTDDGIDKYVIALDGTVWITLDGTLVGTLVHSTITADGDDPIGINWELGNLETNEIGTTTGELKLDGITTDDGTKTYELVATVVILVAGMNKMALVGTDDGTLVLWTTANPEVDKRMTWVDGNEVTTDVATTTGEDQTDGMVTDLGVLKKVTADDGTDWTRLDGTDLGTELDCMITADGDDPIGMRDELLKLETQLIGTMTGDVKLDGTTTDYGTETYEKTGVNCETGT